jgi:hypothetical protein
MSESPEKRQMEEENLDEEDEQQKRKQAMKVHVQMHKDKRKQHILAKRRPATLGREGFEGIKAQNVALLATAPNLRTELQTSPNNNNSTNQNQKIPQMSTSPNSSQLTKETIPSFSDSNNAQISNSSSPNNQLSSGNVNTNTPTQFSSQSSLGNNPSIIVGSETTDSVKTHQRRGSGSVSNDKLPPMMKPKQDHPQKLHPPTSDLRRRVIIYFLYFCYFPHFFILFSIGFEIAND